METTQISACYTLDDAIYRAEVAAATGPVARQREARIPVGDLTPAARLALVDAGLANLSCPKVECGVRASAPSAAEASDVLVALGAAEAARSATRRALVLAALDELERDPAPAIDWRREWVSAWMAAPCAVLRGDGQGCPPDLRPRIAAIRERVTVTLTAEREERETREVAEVAAKVAAKAATAAVVAGHEAEARAWIATGAATLPPELIRAAGEGRRVLAEITRVVRERVRQAVEDLAPHGIASSHGEEPRDDVPSAEAYEILDLLTSSLKGLRAAALLPGAEIEIGAIARHDVNPSGAAVWRTGVEVTLSHAWLDEDYGWVVLAEPRAEDDEDDDSDE